ncbi:MAG: PIG-L family deacetylase [Deinococcus sp.]|nr:PIG-L family deacetylase [Deinococcus sp.]
MNRSDGVVLAGTAPSLVARLRRIRRLKRWLLWPVLGLALLALLGGGLWYLQAAAIGPWGRAVQRFYSRITLQSFVPLLRADQRILILAPHPDDEILGAGGLISRQIAQGAQVQVVLVTNGDGYRYAITGHFLHLQVPPADYRRLAYRRQQETLAALGTLGLDSSSVIFLGYPDRGVARMWTDYWEVPYRSPFTRATASPYDNSYTPEAPFTGQALLHDLSEILDRFQPTQLYLPHPNDIHPDHWATYCFAMLALEMARLRGESWALAAHTLGYLVHRGELEWPRPRGYHPELSLYPPPAMAALGDGWAEYPLVREEVELKRRAILQYRSLLPTQRGFLLAFARRNELFIELAPLAAPRVTPGSIKVDGRAADWLGVAPLLRDPINDALTRTFTRGGDIQALYVALDDGRLAMRLAVDGGLLPGTRYQLRLFALRRDLDGQVRLERHWWGPVGGSTAAEMVINGRVVEWKASLEALGYPEVVILSWEARGPTPITERTAWATLVLPDMAVIAPPAD